MTTQVNAVTQAMNQLQGTQDAPRSLGGEGNQQRPDAGEDAGKARHEALPSPQAHSGPAATSHQAPSSSARHIPEGTVEMPPLPPALAASAASHPSRAGSTVPAVAKESYDRTLKKFKEGDIEAARQGFAEFLTTYPDSALAGNAQYWLGEAYYAKKQYEQAIEHFDRVVSEYAGSEKVPSALLMKGMAYLGLKDRKRAAAALRQVMEGYPKSTQASKAADKLAQLKVR
jgi:tol-pal system protein YbgF